MRPIGSLTRKEDGQVILILLGAIALGLTLGLAVASRSSVDVGLSRKLDDNAKAFSAAEAGVEEILKSPQSSGNSVQLNLSGAKATIQSVPTPSAGGLYSYPDVINIGDVQTLWLVNHALTPPYAIDESAESYGGSQIYLCWSGQDSIKIPGIEVSVTYKNNTDLQYYVARRAYKSGGSICPNGIGSGDCFDGVDTISGVCDGYQYEKNISFASTFGLNLNSGVTKLYLRVRPYYDAVHLGIQTQGGKQLPRQAIVDAYSIGQSATGGETSKIRVFQGYPGAPPVFDFALFSGQGVTIR